LAAASNWLAVIPGIFAFAIVAGAWIISPARSAADAAVCEPCAGRDRCEMISNRKILPVCVVDSRRSAQVLALRYRYFADSTLEEGGFELVVPFEKRRRSQDAPQRY